jgi:hypothetical protein
VLCVFEKNEESDSWIVYLEELNMKLEGMIYIIANNQCLIHNLTKLTIKYELQMVLLKKQGGYKANPLEVNEMRNELNLQFERLNFKLE